MSLFISPGNGCGGYRGRGGLYCRGGPYYRGRCRRSLYGPRRRRRNAACGLSGELSNRAAPGKRRLYKGAFTGMVRGAERVAVGAGVGGTVRQPLALYFRPSPAVLRPEEGSEISKSAGGGRGGLTGGRGGRDRPFRPIAGQIL
jgi:hypothetical protein